ncbi:hypothetical protein TruAng_007893 [Truncatella angustata]|nr:hypothetical protein TruAng_007893 [Truncatella angustata]
MPSATHIESPALSSGKKRRWDDNAELQTPLYALQNPPANLEVPSGDPFSVHKYAQAGNGALRDDVDRIVYHHTASLNRKTVPDLTEAWQRKIRPLPSAKRIRVSDDSESPGQKQVKKDQDHSSSSSSNYSTPPVSPQILPQAGARTTSSALLSPCHICHRKPTKRSELDSFADCEGCGQRTCYVCTRQCQGWLPDAQKQPARERSGEDPEEALSRSFTMHDADDEAHWHIEHHNPTIIGAKEQSGTGGWKAKGHGSVICSRCCVERGSQGDVMCLGCLAHVEGA